MLFVSCRVLYSSYVTNDDFAYIRLLTLLALPSGYRDCPSKAEWATARAQRPNVGASGAAPREAG